jgi:ubiquinone/menaquinone biosynthesis C-methylase UbiE
MCFTSNSTTSRILPQNEQAAQIWNAGGRQYDRISGQISDAIEHCVDLLDPQPGERVLDVATGTGWTARRMALRNAAVTGLDFSENAIAAACDLDETGMIDFQIGDAESLPFSNAEFDAVISTFGVMFCGNPMQAAAELARVCKPGGRMALAIWENHGGVYDMFRLISEHKPKTANPGPSPFEWANDDRLHEWLGGQFDLSITRGVSMYCEETAADAWDAFATGYGPTKTLIAKLSVPQVDAFRRDFIAFHDQYQSNAGMRLPRPYLVVTGTKK